MNIVGLIDPKCNVPLFSMTNIETAYTCGNISGYLMAGTMTVVILLLMMFYLRKTTTVYNDTTKTTQTTSSINFASLTLGIFALVIVWVAIPSASAWLNARTWSGYNAQIEAYVSGGMPRAEALNRVQSLYQTNIQTNALNNVANSRKD